MSRNIIRVMMVLLAAIMFGVLGCGGGGGGGSRNSTAASDDSVKNLAYTVMLDKSLFFSGSYKGNPVKMTYKPGSHTWSIYSGPATNRIRMTYNSIDGLQEILALDQGTRVTVNNIDQDRVEFRIYSDTKFVIGSVIYYRAGKWYNGLMKTEDFKGYDALTDVLELSQIGVAKLTNKKFMLKTSLGLLLPKLDLVSPVFAAEDFDPFKEIQNEMKDYAKDKIQSAKDFVFYCGRVVNRALIGGAYLYGAKPQIDTINFIAEGAALGMAMVDNIKTSPGLPEVPFSAAINDTFTKTTADTPYALNPAPVAPGRNYLYDPFYPDPIVSFVDPLVAKMKQDTTFTVHGENLRYGQLDFKLENCYGITESKVSGSSTERRFSCIPSSPGKLKGTITNYSKYTNDLLKTFEVEVQGSEVSSVLPAPTNFKVTKTGNATWSMSWDPVPGADDYFVYQKIGSAPAVTQGHFTDDSIFAETDLFDYVYETTTDSGTVDRPATYYWVVVAGRFDPADDKYHFLGKPSAPASIDFTTSTPASSKGVMTLSVPWHGVSEFKFPETPYSFYLNQTMALFGIIQSTLVFKSDTSITDPSYSGPVYIRVMEQGSAATEFSIGFTMSTSSGYYYYQNVLGGDLSPFINSSSDICHVSGNNPQSLPSCTALGINFDRAGGKITLKNVNLYSARNNVTQIKDLQLSFTPY